MKKRLIPVAVFLFVSCFVKSQNIFPSSGSAGIGTTSPNASALLEVRSTKKGVLIPRMTRAQRNAIASPAKGLLIFQTNGGAGFYYYNNGWHALSPSITGLAKTHLSKALINQLKPKTYQFRNDGQYSNLNLPKGNHFGLLA